MALHKMLFSPLWPVRLAAGRGSNPLVSAELTVIMTKALDHRQCPGLHTAVPVRTDSSFTLNQSAQGNTPPPHTHHTYTRDINVMPSCGHKRLNQHFVLWLFTLVHTPAFVIIFQHCVPSIEHSVEGGNQPNIAGQELMCGREYEWQLFGCECEQCSFYVIVCLRHSKLIFPFSCVLLSHFFYCI